MFNTTWAGLDMTNPAVAQVLRTDGDKGFFGWPDMPAISALRDAWLDAPDVASQRRICDDIQRAALKDIPFLPLGQFFSRTAYRRSLADRVAGVTVFWNVRKT